jgi:hypothetical protein
MPSYRYSRLQNDLDDEEDAHQQPFAVESSPKDSYRLRLVISGGIITMLIITVLVLYHGKIEHLFCQMVCTSQKMV